MSARAAPRVITYTFNKFMCHPYSGGGSSCALDSVTSKVCAAAVVMRAAAVQAPWLQAVQGVAEMLDDIGTAIYNFYTGAMQFLAGPVRAPLGSNVRVESSTLQIGDIEVPADWYFTDTDEPAGIIYLQHGFMATAGFYSATAASSTTWCSASCISY